MGATFIIGLFSLPLLPSQAVRQPQVPRFVSSGFIAAVSPSRRKAASPSALSAVYSLEQAMIALSGGLQISKLYVLAGQPDSEELLRLLSDKSIAVTTCVISDNFDEEGISLMTKAGGARAVDELTPAVELGGESIVVGKDSVLAVLARAFPEAGIAGGAAGSGAEERSEMERLQLASHMKGRREGWMWKGHDIVGNIQKNRDHHGDT
ncbi:unnamed protein product [Vitrella brassicaformis CCMP3155]|uniref:Uncharacterized protein n=1 Tax=Vitrella brassicaformis (strain CCMP3155) TaxID=1169540 RepID=A0A0G4GYC1_VITBC|nr:unnamed protein product [Vitrella brassicaformis CCMP3155]|mmetsp:Transcript_11652/g.33932  ORF Transcript_11652/g.33932 Transcript_11652/m.33932 type:complete len:208 (+) Transcript_11652:93-716(+)|eukprot:CEM36104.1 unnamed protein product [Vitrella brassicaformis CCMP3155]